MIGLVDVDGKGYPNLALMKLSSWFKAHGEEVEFANPLSEYEAVFMSKVFTFTEEYPYSEFGTGCEIYKGGSGYGDYSVNLPYGIEHSRPDYSLYGIKDKAYGFTTRGCPNHCPFCLVHDKEGGIAANAHIEEFWNGQKNLILMDNNILASDHGLHELERIAWKGIRLDCNQGLDARIAAEDDSILRLLARIRWIRYPRIACDQDSEIEPCLKVIRKVREYGGKKTPFMVYTIIRDSKEDALNRINAFRNIPYAYPFAQPFRDFGKARITPPLWQRNMARWCNSYAIKCDFEEYIANKRKER